MNKPLMRSGRQSRYFRLREKAVARLRLHVRKCTGRKRGLGETALEAVIHMRAHRFARRLTSPIQLYFQQRIKANQRVELTTARLGVTAVLQGRSTTLSRLVLRAPGAPSYLSHTGCSCTSRASAQFLGKQPLLSGQW